MTNTILAAVYAALGLISLALFLLPLRKKRRGALDLNFQFLVAMLFAWQLVLFLYNTADDAAFAMLLYNWNLPFVALTTLAWFLYIVRFYGLDSFFPKIVVAALLVIPMFTLGLAVTGEHHAFLRAELEIVIAAPLHIVRAVRGPWFWYHAVYCYLLLTVAFVVALRQHARLLRTYRRPSAMLLVGLTVSVFGNILVLITNTPFDLSLIAASISSVLLYAATENNRSLDFFLQARKEVFHHINKAILILDGENGIVTMNATAERWLRELDVTVRRQSYGDIAEQLKARTERIGTPEDEEGGLDCHMMSGGVYNVRRKPVYDNRGSTIGTFLIASDVTENRELIARLDAVAGMDTLTGLSNRRQMRTDIEELDAPRHLPLTILAGDLNGLKEINDRLGHQQGDIYIRAAAEALRTTCPPNARIARTGGDEFVALVPGCDRARAEALAGEITAAFCRTEGHPFRLSIAVGFAVKEAEAQDVEVLMREADEMMYRVKREQKAGSHKSAP